MEENIKLCPLPGHDITLSLFFPSLDAELPITIGSFRSFTFVYSLNGDGIKTQVHAAGILEEGTSATLIC